MSNKIENKMTYEETLERATTTPREEEFRKILRENRQGLSTDREAYIRTCKLLGVEVALNDPWWIVIERDSGSDLAVGPFPTEAMAAVSMDDSLLIQGLVEEDCLDCWTTNKLLPDNDPSIERVIIDLDDPDHTGVSK